MQIRRSLQECTEAAWAQLKLCDKTLDFRILDQRCEGDLSCRTCRSSWLWCQFKALISIEQLSYKEFWDCHHKILPSALLVLQSWAISLSPIGPEHGGDELLTFGPKKSLGVESPRISKHLWVICYKRLIPKQHLTLLDLKRRIMRLKYEIFLGSSILVRYWGVNSEAFIDHRSHQWHLPKWLQRNFVLSSCSKYIFHLTR